MAAIDAMSNSTLLTSPDTYFGIYNELSKYNVHLNVFERLWAVCTLQTAATLPANFDTDMVYLHAK
jgi:hypothetical protein